MRTFNSPGTFANQVSVVGDSARDGRPWPDTTAQSSVTANGSDMTVSKSHVGTFAAGATGHTCSLRARISGNQPTSGTVTLQDSLPSGLTARGISGSGWSCVLASLTCTRNDPLPGGTAYPQVTVTVDVAADAPEQVTNVATVSGGGEVPTGNNSANDPTTITRATSPDPPSPDPPAPDPPPDGGTPGPDNRITFGSTKRNRDGSINLRVDVPGPGELSADDAPKAADRGAAAKRPPGLLKRARATATRAGMVTLKLRPSKTTKRRLAKKPSQRARVQVTFTPTGGAANSELTRVKFKAPRRK
jgi:hypothetical protein